MPILRVKVLDSKESVAQQVMVLRWVVADHLRRHRHHHHRQVHLVMRILPVKVLDSQETVAQQVTV